VTIDPSQTLGGFYSQATDRIEARWTSSG